MKNIILEKNNTVATVWFNKPKLGNAIDFDMYKDLYTAFEDCKNDDSIKVIILAGKGNHFSSGGDIENLMLPRVLDHSGFTLEETKFSTDVIKMIRNCHKVTIARLQGAVVGAGLAFACACDFRIADTTATFSTGFINMGLAGDTAGVYGICRVIPLGFAQDLLLSGRFINAQKAKEIGLVNEVSEDLDKTVNTYVKRFINGPTKAYNQQKELISEFIFDNNMFEEYIKKESVYMSESSRTEDFEKTVLAFMNKKK